ncbi:Carboxypeptidase [Citrus sinensis]|nr:Carboxypeptidase [Citrus sinensis]
MSCHRMSCRKLLGWRRAARMSCRKSSVARGHYVPQLSKAIIRHNQATGEKAINLKGYMVGNYLTDDYHDYLGLFQFWWSTGLISDDTYKQLNLLCDYESFVHPSSSCDKFLEVVGHASEKYDPCTEKHSVVYFNQPEVQKALHVIPAVAPAKWETCSGDTDVVIPVTSTRYSIDGRMDPRVCRTYLCHREGSRPRNILSANGTAFNDSGAVYSKPKPLHAEGSSQNSTVDTGWYLASEWRI